MQVGRKALCQVGRVGGLGALLGHHNGHGAFGRGLWSLSLGILFCMGLGERYLDRAGSKPLQ